MKKFLLKLLLFLFPILFLGMLYVYLDPFKVVFSYKNYYEDGKPSLVGLNRDYVSVETFKINFPVYRYDSYIMGNSRSRFYRSEDWKKHIDSDRIFHFDAGGESLYGLSKKIEFLDERKVPIKNALLVIDYELLLRVADVRSHLFSKHPDLSGENLFTFHADFLKVFFSKTFLQAFLDLKISGQVKPYMLHNWVFDNVPVTYHLKTNELTLSFLEDSIEHHQDMYYRNKEHVFHQRGSNNVYPIVIGKPQLKMLALIHRKFEKDKTNFRVIISPLYNQFRLNPDDLQIIQRIFGKENIYDFSGKNELTEPITNFYENSHYRVTVAKAIMDSVYSR